MPDTNLGNRKHSTDCADQSKPQTDTQWNQSLVTERKSARGQGVRRRSRIANIIQGRPRG